MGRGQAFRLSAPQIIINPQIQALLAKPTWSVGSLIAPKGKGIDGSVAAVNEKKNINNNNNQVEIADEDKEEEEKITPEKLRHLLKLSALPPPKDAAEEQDMLNTLRQQIHFVKEIQKVDTTGIEPLVALRNETVDGIWNNTITEETLQPYFEQEEYVGENGTIRRKKDPLQHPNKDHSKLDDPAEPLMSQSVEDPQTSENHTVDLPAVEPLMSQSVQDPQTSENHTVDVPSVEPLVSECKEETQLGQDHILEDLEGRFPSQIMENPFNLSTKGETEEGRRIGRYFYVQRRNNRNRSQERRAESTTSPD